jgi:hypothetical protein
MSFGSPFPIPDAYVPDAGSYNNSFLLHCLINSSLEGVDKASVVR